MYKELIPQKIERVFNENNDSIYEVIIRNKKYYLSTTENSRNVLMNPEIVSINLKNNLERVIYISLNTIYQKEAFKNINIFTILRGGLNFPIEEACNKISPNLINGISFITSERIFDSDLVSRLESNYTKILPINDGTIIVGDIVATGNTLRNSFDLIIKIYKENTKTFDKIILITIGTFQTIEFVENLEKDLKELWPNFKGIDVIFIEGIFNTHKDRGILDLNLPTIDFYINKSLISPEFRRCLFSKIVPLFEKCMIYDGGARRYEINDHLHFLYNYWIDLVNKLDEKNYKIFISEKTGLNINMSFNEWLLNTNYINMERIDLKKLYKDEIDILKNFNYMICHQLLVNRLHQIILILKDRGMEIHYEK